MAEWLCSGLQSRLRRFDSGFSLQKWHENKYQPPPMNISILGTGYVGLVTGACLSDIGHRVTCVDSNRSKIAALKKSKLPFYEKDLRELVIKNQQLNSLTFTTSYKTCAKNSIFFICVDTPNDSDGNPNLSNLENLLLTLLQNIKSNSLLIIKSTVPLGTVESIQQQCNQFTQELPFDIEVCSNPEFLREGSAVHDFLSPDRVILGAKSAIATKQLKQIYSPLKLPRNKLLSMSVESAELTKYAANCFLATKISFMNEIAQIADSSGANIHEVKLGVGSDKRIGGLFLNSGIGFGGSCFPKDLLALISTQNKFNLRDGILKKTIEVNYNQLDYFLEKIYSCFGASLVTKNIAIWGTAFKPETDDMRESVAIKLIKALAPKVNSLCIYDPLCSKQSIKLELRECKNFTIVQSKDIAISNADALIICTESSEFMAPNYSNLEHLTVFDGRNILDKSALNMHGIKYYGVGI